MKWIVTLCTLFLNVTFLQAQNVGIGTTTPFAKLHVVDGLSGMSSTQGTMAIESAAAENVLQFKSIESAKSGIVFAGPSNSTRASILFNHPTNYGGINIGFGLSGFGISYTNQGYTGLGTTSPEAKLHVLKGNAGVVTAHLLAGIVLENSDHGYLQFLNPAAKEGGIMFGNPNGTAQGGMYYNNPANPEGLDFRTNGNNVRMTIDNAGKVEMKGGLAIKGNNPAAGAILRSADNLGNTTWQRPVAFKASGLYGAASQTMPINAWTKVLFGAAEYNEGLNYQQAASFFVAPVAGIYHFDVQLAQQNDWHHYMRIEAKRGNSIIVLAQENTVAITFGISTDVKLMAGDEISVSFLQQYESVTLLSHPDGVFFNGHLITQF